MTELFVAVSTVLINFAVGFIVGRYIYTKQKPKAKQQEPINTNASVKWAAEYRNFLNYDGTEQLDVE